MKTEYTSKVIDDMKARRDAALKDGNTALANNMSRMIDVMEQIQAGNGIDVPEVSALLAESLTIMKRGVVDRGKRDLFKIQWFLSRDVVETLRDENRLGTRFFDKDGGEGLFVVQLVDAKPLCGSKIDWSDDGKIAHESFRGVALDIMMSMLDDEGYVEDTSE